MRQYKYLITPLISLVILTLGSALLTTFLSLKMHALGINTILIGALSTAYYGGMVLGAFKLEGMIFRVGHIRSYSAFASILAVTAMLHGLYLNAYFWLLLRLIEGIATAGLYIVIESWILSSSDHNNRGSALALYMLGLYIAQSIGQYLLNIGHQETLILYAVSSVFASLSVIPLALTKVDVPSFSEPKTLSIREMFQMSPSGVTTCIASGLTLGSIYGLYPVYLQQLHFSLHNISTIMGLTIFGGMFFQYPIGKLSDKVSRRQIIAFLGIAASAISLLLLLFSQGELLSTSGLSFLLGGTVFCLYPIGISHACDRVENHQIVSATQTLLLFYGIGATIGPMLAPLFHLFSKKDGLLIYFITILLPLSAYMFWRKSVVSPVPEIDKQDFSLSVEMTPVASEIDPRAEVAS